jgi:hypothetical protein
MTKTLYPAFLLLLICSNVLRAQVPAWGGGADQNDLSFGFTFGYLTNNYKIIKQPNWRAPFFDQGTNKYITDSLNSITSNKQPGFSIGFITRYRLTDHLEARITPSLVLADGSLSYTYVDPSENVTKQVQTTTVDFPLLLKLKSDRIGDFRAYLLGGVKYTLAIGKGDSNNNTSSDPLNAQVKTASGFASYEAGLGCDIYFEFFKLSPEIKISNSIGNVLVTQNQPFSSPISKLFLHTLSLSLYFE